jgi:Tol biopolymer transport system component/DNA-binding winged helix-turn-helix (wHTH) protein
MNDMSRTPAPGRTIDLADEVPFRLGALAIDPPARQVVAGAQNRTIEPRVMQVLVALARAEGGVVSREQLIARCWGGRVVGDDAINSSLAKVRAIASLGDEPAFEIETIPRVGYRLHGREPAPNAADVTPPAAPATVRPPFREYKYAWPSAVIVLLLAGLLALYFQRPRGSNWAVVESHQPFVSMPLIERYPALSPDGTMLAYSAGSTVENRHIFLRFVRGGDALQLTHDDFDATAPAWSPDGRLIAYLLFEDGHPCRIMEIPVPEGMSRQLGACRTVGRSSIAWDRSGSALYYSDAAGRGTPPRIFRLDLQNGRSVPVTSPPASAVADDSPSVSPDGASIAYLRQVGGERIQIRLHSLADGQDRPFANFDDGDDGATWSPDGRSIFISRWKSEQTSIWSYPIDGGVPAVITAGNGYFGRLSVTANGLVAVESEVFMGHLVSSTPGSASAPAILDHSGVMAWSLDYASDGTLLALGHRGSLAGVWIAPPGATFRELFPLSVPHNGALRWSPDGSRFAYIQQVPDGYDIPVLSRSGAPLLKLHYAAKESAMLQWSPDGKSIVTDRQEPKGWRIWRTDLSDPQRSVPISEYGWKYPCIRGAMLFAENDGAPGVWRLDGGARRVASGPSAQFSDMYTVSGHNIIYYDDSNPTRPSLMARNIAGGPPSPLVTLGEGQGDFEFAVNPLTGAVVYPYAVGSDTDIALLRVEKR